MMDLVGPTMTRLVGDYILGPKIGSGSFAVVWRSRHRNSGLVVAIKEIDKTQLSPKVRDNLIKEISILSTIHHPNIIQLFEVIQTNDRIYLVLEYCGGGDLSAYINRYGRVSESVARHFMRQLAAGLQVLQEKNLIHRDLKPQNLLLAATSATPLMKIGDFGFARSLTPLQLADTLCGSPYYMAPEIIQSQKYDAKADLWSVGAILYQLVVGKPPFDGNSQLQLFQNILASTELHFPPTILKEIHPDCVDLCRSLLRRNPDERLTFKAFFNHNFLQEHRSGMDIEQFHSYQSETSMINQAHFEYHAETFVDDPVVVSSAVNETMLLQKKGGEITADGDTKNAAGLTPTIALDKPGKSIHTDTHLSNQAQVSHLMESIEKGYVLINSHFASLEDFSVYFEASMQENPASGISISPSKRTSLEIRKQTEDLPSSSTAGLDNFKSNELEEFVASFEFATLKKEREFSLLHPSNRLELLHRYVQVLGELSQEKYNTGLYLESLAVELVVLAIWKKTLDICSTWLDPISEGELPRSSSVNESIIACGDTSLSQTMERINFSDRLSASLWAKRGFIIAVDRAEKLSSHIQNMDGTVEMPDAVEIIFQEALLIGTNGAVDEYMNNKDKSAASYSKAMLLLSFIVGEAENLPLNPPFSLLADGQKRIMQYIRNLQFRKKSLSESASKE
ncbi:serine/threonine-protein kinase ATG1a isoform X2 [Trifolium pratense]|uniref:serine/threonine-protein kinase ATG1a isoform X2 n=1 Tax=Trifolium pratense TaxID=57577 RepID=UPI001E690B70|nr:serine/threonine-protein kinase ATG1a isoform X2 [Trifolium pratense]